MKKPYPTASSFSSSSLPFPVVVLRSTMPAKNAPSAASIPNRSVMSSRPTSNTMVMRRVDCEVAWRFSVMMAATRVPEISRVSHTSTKARPPIEAMMSASHQVR